MEFYNNKTLNKINDKGIPIFYIIGFIIGISPFIILMVILQ